MNANEAIRRLDDMQSQIIHGKRTFGEIADLLRGVVSALDKAGTPVGDEHREYALTERIEHIATARDYFMKETDKSRADTTRINWLENHHVTLEGDYETYESSVRLWSGNINDRECNEVGRGASIREALDAAIAKTTRKTTDPEATAKALFKGFKPLPRKVKSVRAAKAIHRAQSIIEDIKQNHLPRVIDGLNRGYVDENQMMVCLDHMMRARILMEEANNI